MGTGPVDRKAWFERSRTAALPFWELFRKSLSKRHVRCHGGETVLFARFAGTGRAGEPTALAVGRVRGLAPTALMP